ncbi:MAG: UvrD-helicase domain-containing protein, partial [Myxococcota bacterium]
MSSGADARRADAEARRLAQVVFDRPVVLEAGAGTGKTSALVARVVCWCLGEGWERGQARLRDTVRRSAPSPDAERDRVAADVLSRVSAITFTEAAAAEMAERVGEAFSALASGELRPGLLEETLPADLEERSVRARALLGALDHLVVRTIHAWCRRLLARHPLESGMHPAFQVDADGSLQAEVVREVVEDATRRAYAQTEGSVLLDLAVEGGGPGELQETLLMLLEEGVTPAVLGEDPLAPERIRTSLRDFETCLADAEQSGVFLMLAATRAKRTQATLQALATTQAAVTDALVAAAAEPFAALESLVETLREAWEDENRKRLDDWARGRFLKGEGEALLDAAPAVARSVRALRPWVGGVAAVEPARFDRVRRALVPLLARVDHELRARGIATYASLLTGACDLLRSQPEHCARIRREMDQLLVDEFQDTDALQCEIVRWLALRGPENERPGLFLVGDPKQSIYGWRSADLAAYDAFVQEVEEAGGEIHGLSVNFRSVAPILDEVESVIEPVMERIAGLQPGFQPLVVCDALAAEPGFDQADAAPVEHWVSWGWDAEEGRAREKFSAAERVTLEARALARDLRRRHEEQGVAYRSMAILLRGMGDVEEYLAALRAEGVPYAVERDRNYYRRREVIDAAALVRCVLDPLDQLALLTLLRSPAAGVPDAAWIPLWARGFPDRVAGLCAQPAQNAEMLQSLGGLLREVAQELVGQQEEVPGLERIAGWESSAVAMLETIALSRESFERDAADVFVEKMRAFSMLETTEAARYQGVFRAANLARFFRELRDDLLHGRDPQAILRRLRMDVARRPDAAEERPPRLLEDVVPVMTIHRAKGLDFDHVYLPQLHKEPGSKQVPTAAAIPWKGALELSLLGLPSLGLAAARSAQERVAAAERVRTLYVAMTRAKQRLVLMGSWKEGSEPPAVERAVSHMDLLASRRTLPASLGDRMAALSAQQASHFVDDTSARWVYPALLTGAGGSTAGGDAGSASPPDIAAVERDARELEELRQRAGERMRRRWGGVASGTAPGEHREVTAARHFEWVAEPGGLPVAAFEGDNEAGEVARLAGIAVHRVLEEFRLDAEPAAELALQVARLPDILDGQAPDALRDATLARAGEILGHFGEGPLFQRFAAIVPAVVARELDVWTPGQEEGEGQPVAYTAGTVDLLYRDPETRDWVVADYKTDRVEDPEALASRAAGYRRQGE